MKTYDYIICGGGMAGLSLAFYLNRSETLRDKKVLIVEPLPKNTNDRTWRFWEIGLGDFDKILYGSWQKLSLKSQYRAIEFDMNPYTYKKIRGIDFYNFVFAEIRQNPNVEFLQEHVLEIKEMGEGVQVRTDSETVAGMYAFDSTFRPKMNNPKHHNFLQHFKGWVIKTPEPRFDPTLPTWMDFRVPHENDCRFVYTLPYSANTALVEYTLFNEQICSESEYKAVLKNYIEDTLGVKHYEVLEEEQGVIPMTDEPMDEYPSPHLVRIGTSGGYTHAATGYTFARTQKFLKQIVANLESSGSPKRNHIFFEKRFDWYASTFLDVLQRNSVSAEDLFIGLFLKNKSAKIFKFLHNETSFAEELRIMASTNLWAFGKSFFGNFK